MSVRLRQHLYYGAFGLVLGFCLQRIGFADFGELHRLFTLQDFRLFFTFLGGVAIAMLGLAVLARGQVVASKPYHKGSILGGALFGAGWAVTGACPSVALIYVAQGKLVGMATIVGILLGILIYNRLKPRYFRWSTGACE